MVHFHPILFPFLHTPHIADGTTESFLIFHPNHLRCIFYRSNFSALKLYLSTVQINFTCQLLQSNTVSDAANELIFFKYQWFLLNINHLFFNYRYENYVFANTMKTRKNLPKFVRISTILKRQNS